MNLSPMLLYKTQYFFVKGGLKLSGLRHRLERSIPIDAFLSYDVGELLSLSDEIYRHRDRMIEIVTSVGTILLREFQDAEQMAELASEYSNEGACGAYLSMRTVDYYGVAFARGGKLLRQIYTGEEESVLRGDLLDHERSLDLQLDEEELYLQMDETNTLQLFELFLGFEVEDFDFDVKEVNVYQMQTIVNDCRLRVDLYEKIRQNFFKNRVRNAMLYLYNDSSCAVIRSLSVFTTESVAFHSTYCINVDENVEKHLLQMIAIQLNDMANDLPHRSVSDSDALTFARSQYKVAAQDAVCLVLCEDGAVISPCKVDGKAVGKRTAVRCALPIDLRFLENVTQIGDYCMKYLLHTHV